MFTFDSKVAKQNCNAPEDVVIMFIVCLDNGRELPVYLSTPECLLSVMENIRIYLASLKEYVRVSGYSYGCLKLVGYVK